MTQCIWICFIICVSLHHVMSDNLWGDVANHPAWSLLNAYDCGFSAADRIIGGVNAALGQFPWIVRLGYIVSGEDELDWMCGGALITDRHVLTAGHCVQTDEDLTLTKISMGEYDTTTNPDCQWHLCAPPIQNRGYKAIKIHPSFNKPAFHNDIAIIVLDHPVQLNDYVLPICLPRAEQLGDLKLGELVTVAGWGKMNMTTEERAKILQFVSVPVVTPDICDKFGKGFKLLKTEICAGAQLNKDACGGDSGGPLMKVFDTTEGPKNYIMGVVSFGPTICGIRKPGVYTSVPHFLHWILDTIMQY